MRRNVGSGMVQILLALALLAWIKASAIAQAPHQPRASRAASVAAKRVRRPSAAKPERVVAYDARDRRYYPLSWAKAHGMVDPAGDPLVPLPISKLPTGANPTLVPGR
jgi:hypothetical protein